MQSVADIQAHTLQKLEIRDELFSACQMHTSLSESDLGKALNITIYFATKVMNYITKYFFLESNYITNYFLSKE